MTEIVVRACRTTDEMDECVQMQGEVWGFQTSDIIPRRMFVVASKIGGQVIGAFDGAEMVGFAMAIPGVRNGAPYLHSHMLAVREGYRDAGLGRRLKLFQREEALGRGITLMEWTFDPLQFKNAHLNLAKLGAIVRRNTRSFYGITTSSLQAGLPTDRLHAEWWLSSARVESFLAGRSQVLKIEKRVVVPAAVAKWKQSDATKQRAREVQIRIADELELAFGEGLAIVGFRRDESGDGVYELGKVPENL